MISIRNLTMTYALDDPAADGVQVLKSLDLEIGAGASAAIVGPSGSGKTTLLLLLAGLEQPTDGHIELAGVNLSGLSADQLADLRRDRLGIVFQSFHLIPSLTALGNVSLPLEIAGQQDARMRAESMLERVGLAHRLNHYPTQLSGGEQQRVAIARALVHEPALLLADEPTGNLDKRTGAKVRDLLFRLHEDMGSTLVMVTHDDDMAARCDRQFRLDEGNLIERARHDVTA